MHYLLTEAIELGSTLGFCHVISDHLICQIIFDVNVALGLLIGDKESIGCSNDESACQHSCIVGLEQHGALVVMIEDILLDWISLCLEK